MSLRCNLILTACLLPVFCAPHRLLSQEQTLPPVVVTGTRLGSVTHQTPYAVQVLGAHQLHGVLAARTLSEAISELPGVMTQKTAFGQGSPFIRGFTGYRTLVLVDGVRLNNSTFRDGPNQYLNTIDPFTISQAELLKGPASALHGSDAIGGTLNFLTQPTGNTGEWKGRWINRHRSAADAFTSRLEARGPLAQSVSVSLGISRKDFGDLRGGHGMGLQPQTGYDELDADAKLNWVLDDNRSITLTHLNVQQDDVPRTHKTIHAKSWHGTAVGSELQRELDQRRSLTYLRYEVNSALATLSWQRQEESRFRLRSHDRIDRQGFEVGTLGLSLNLESNSALGILHYGADWYHDRVNSFRQWYKSDGSVKSVAAQGPVADDATYELGGIFVQGIRSMMDERLDVVVGSRVDHASADANSVTFPGQAESRSLSDSWGQYTGNLRLLLHVDEAQRWNLFAGYGGGFRAPNLSDLTRLDSARSNEFEVPSAGLKPERYHAIEAGLKIDLPKFTSQIAFFYTDIADMIVRVPTGRIVDGEHEVTRRNSGDGFVHGFEIEAVFELSDSFDLFGSLAWMDGRLDTYPTSQPVLVREPLDRMMPLTGLAGLRWHLPENNAWLEAVVISSTRQAKLSSRDQTDTQRIPPGGTPGYTMLQLRGGWRLADNWQWTLGVHNLTNEDYRIHGSGLNEPGRGAVSTLEWRF